MTGNSLIPFNEHYVLTPFGLHNNSIICYFNSLLQALFSCSSLTEYLLNNESKFSNNNFMKLYINIIKSHILINSKQNQFVVENSNIILFNEFLNMIKNKNIHFGYNQEDSGELLIILLDVINDQYIYNLFYNKYKTDIYCRNCKKILDVKDDISVQFELNIDNIATNYLKSEINKNLHIMNQFLQNNYSECDNYICSNCNTKELCIKINRLLLMPTIIVINFNKYLEKKTYNYPLELSFINKQEKKKYNYKIVSVINHSGTMIHGHYISKALRKDTDTLKTYILNDSSYELSTFQPESNSYILFYHFVNVIEYYL